MENTHGAKEALESRTTLGSFQTPAESFKPTSVIESTVNEDQNEHVEEEKEYDRYKDNPDLLNETKLAGGSRLFSYDWANGFVSPYRPTPQDILASMLKHVHFSSPSRKMILDLGCGDGLVLRRALETFTPSKLVRAVGVDLDRALLEQSRDEIVAQTAQTQTTSSTISRNDATLSADSGLGSGQDENEILSRLELYYGDIVERYDEPLLPILIPRGLSDKITTMGDLLMESSHVFVYLLPEALSKLAPLLLDLVEKRQKVVLSMRWEIPELQSYLVCGGTEQHFYIYELIQ
ncbi:hypothetical protein BGZ83_006097 [Gryganskiella cystojenkinii]|nr:hypothetical protein BGZ83_006097 [Gryganskiella cystojenkinii]